jgi:predicted small lipoprotein YifL
MNPRQGKEARRRWVRVCAAAVIVCGVSAGCGRKAPDYVPSSTSSREALEAALNAWVNGQRIGPINTVSPPIQVVDSAWWKGQRLANYEIVSEETSVDGLPCFTVRLRKSNPDGEETVRYIVTGRSPMWVYREEDYKNSQSWGGYK